MKSDQHRDPRVRRTHADVLRVAGELLLNTGWDQVTHANVAEEAGYSKATIYKHWPQPEDLLRAAFVHVGGFSHGEVNGDLRDDLISELEAFRRVLIDEKLATSLVALADRAATSPQIARIRDHFLNEGQSLLVELIRRGIRDRGLRRGLDVGPAADMLTGALVYRIAIMGEAVEPDYVESIVDAFLRGTQSRSRGA